METNNQTEIMSQSFAHLEDRLGELLALGRTLKQENASLRRQNEKLLEERSTFNLTKNQVKSQVESLVSRLKLMEST